VPSPRPSPAAAGSPTPGGTPAAGEYRPRTGPHVGYGFNGFFTFQPIANPAQLANLQRSLDLVEAADFGWIRQQVVWATLEPQPGQYDINQLAVLDAIAREAAQRQLRVLLTITKAPRWAVASDASCHDGGGVKLCGLPQDPQTLARVATFLAERYRNPEGGRYAGTVAAFEIWN
jgi:hypothetical protein